jgi:hypothetical protein
MAVSAAPLALPLVLLLCSALLASSHRAWAPGDAAGELRDVPTLEGGSYSYARGTTLLAFVSDATHSAEHRAFWSDWSLRVGRGGGAVRVWGTHWTAWQLLGDGADPIYAYLRAPTWHHARTHFGITWHGTISPGTYVHA